MTDVQAVIGIGQLKRLEKMNEKRRYIQEKYNSAFNNRPWFKAPAYSHTVQYYSAHWEDRDGLCQFLGDKGIATSVHFKPLYELTYWSKGKKRSLPNTDKTWRTLLSLPVHDSLTERDLTYIIDSVFEFYENR